MLLRKLASWIGSHRVHSGIIGAVGLAVPTIILLSIIHYSQVASQRSQSLLNLNHVGASAAVSASPSASPSSSPTPSPTPTPTVQPTPSPTPTSTLTNVVGAIPSAPPSSASPTGRGAAQFAYDTTHHVAVLFGGFGDPDGNTWTWDGKAWTVQPPALSPPSRRGGILIEDPVRHQLLLFGGWTLDSTTYLADTWTWDGSRWTQRSTARSPSARAFATAVFDSRRGNVVLFGGYDEKAFLTDMWTWDGTQWAPKPAPAGTPALSQVGIAYQRADDTLVVVGERTQGTTIFMGLQTWVDDGHSWRQVSGGDVPCDHHYGGAAQDPSTDAIVVFGGQCGNPGELATWKGTAWRVSTSTTAPAPRGQEAGRPALTYDPDHHQMLLFGGVANNGTPIPYGDLWGWNGTAWARLG